MSDIPNWWMKGDWFDVCSCNIPCPCGFAQAPTNNHCEGVLAYHIHEGKYGKVTLDGFNVVGVGMFDGNLWTRESFVTIGFFIDERANEEQREALQNVFSGQAGGWMGEFAQSVGEVRGLEFVPIEFKVEQDLAKWSVEIGDKVKGIGEALTGPTTPEGKRVQVHNASGAEVGPGQIMTLGKAATHEVDALGFKWNWTGKSSKHIPFDWTGPTMQ